MHGLLKEPIISPLKFKMANGRHIANRSSPYFFQTAYRASTSGVFRIVSDTLVLSWHTDVRFQKDGGNIMTKSGGDLH